MSQSSQSQAVAVAVIAGHGPRLPIVRRRVDDGIPPWVLPGGKLESGESPGAAAARGVLEETEPTVADLMTAWTVGRTLLSMVIGSGCRADVLSAGRAVTRALGGVDGATVEAERCLWLRKPPRSVPRLIAERDP